MYRKYANLATFKIGAETRDQPIFLLNKCAWFLLSQVFTFSNSCIYLIKHNS